MVQDGICAGVAIPLLGGRDERGGVRGDGVDPVTSLAVVPLLLGLTREINTHFEGIWVGT